MEAARGVPYDQLNNTAIDAQLQAVPGLQDSTLGGAYQIRDAGWAPKARAICDAARTEREALADTEGGRITNPTPEQMAQRADLVDRATDILERMLDDIVAIPVADENDTLRLSIFEANYRIIIADRRRRA